ncbi:hypothetical protein E2C01_034066 [Portunus trituberculatus]|uniref:Uncharacterized protein n=1 Tax=Portunus trituberculatus TaxID=210409 RepID=A0A5B7F548_PORTR|nr:hypothetical protein [Portunus trituberculatus]
MNGCNIFKISNNNFRFLFVFKDAANSGEESGKVEFPFEGRLNVVRESEGRGSEKYVVHLECEQLQFHVQLDFVLPLSMERKLVTRPHKLCTC